VEHSQVADRLRNTGPSCPYRRVACKDNSMRLRFFVRRCWRMRRITK